MDEAASLLAIEQVAAHGYPFYPSNVFYSQGLVFSYMAAPLAWVTDSSLELLAAARWLNIVISLCALGVVYIVTCDLTGKRVAGLLASLAIGFDPSFMEWSIWIRPYGLLTLVTLVTVWVSIRISRDGPPAHIAAIPVSIVVAILPWIAVFTHALVAILLPAMLFTCGVLVRRYGFRSLRSLLVAAGVGAGAPILLLLLNSRLGVGSGSGGGGAVVGSHLLTDTLQNPGQTYHYWTRLFDGSHVDNVMPFVFLIAAGALLGLVTNPLLQRRREYAILLAYATLPILLLLVIVTDGGQPRYFSHVFPLGYIVVIVVATELVTGRRTDRFERAARLLLASGLVLISFLYVAQASTTRIERDPPGSNLYLESISWIEERLLDGHIVIMALPQAIVYADDQQAFADQALYLAGPEGRPRTDRYVKTQPDGAVTDYWMGVPAITSTDALCTTLQGTRSTVWFMVDEYRLSNPRFFAGDMATLIIGSSILLESVPNVGLVRQAIPVFLWTEEARAICPASTEVVPPVSQAVAVDLPDAPGTRHPP